MLPRHSCHRKCVQIWCPYNAKGSLLFLCPSRIEVSLASLHETMKVFKQIVATLVVAVLLPTVCLGGGCSNKVYWAKGQADSVQHGKTYGCVACGAASSISRSNNWGTTISVSATFGLSVEVVSASLTAGISRSTGGSVTHTCSKNDLPRRRGNIICIRTTNYPSTLRGTVVHQKSARRWWGGKYCKKSSKYVRLVVNRQAPTYWCDRRAKMLCDGGGRKLLPFR